MLISMHYLVDSYNSLKNVRLKLEGEINSKKKREEAAAEGKKLRDKAEFDISSVTRQVNNAFLDMAMVIEESREMTEGSYGSQLIALQAVLPIIEQRIKCASTVEELCSSIKMITGVLDEWMDNKRYRNVDLYSYSQKFRSHWGDYRSSSDASERAINLFRNALVGTRHPINVFDMHCKGSGRVLRLKDDMEVNLYGLDTSKVLSKESKSSYRRVIYGNLKGCLITNDSFDIVYCLPKITRDRTMKGGVYIKTERDMLTKAADYLKIGGILFYAIPYYRFYREICEHLVKNYEDIQVFSTSGDMDYECKYVYVIGRRRSLLKEGFDVAMYDKLRNLPLHYADMIDMNPQALNPIQLPDMFTEVKRFRGSELNESEIEELFASSKCTTMFWKDQKVEKLGESKSRPLLPFNVGQLGLVLTSGCLDGVIDEGDGFCHAVKGRVIKRVDNVESIDRDSHQIQVTSTTSNRVEINAFLPDGTYKCLA